MIPCKLMKPYDAEWGRLSYEKRLEVWFEENRLKMRGEPEGFQVEDYKTMMENFCISCKKPRIGDYINFRRDIKDFLIEDQKILVEGFFTMYNISPMMLLLRSVFGEYEPGKN